MDKQLHDELRNKFNEFAEQEKVLVALALDAFDKGKVELLPDLHTAIVRLQELKATAWGLMLKNKGSDTSQNWFSPPQAVGSPNPS